MPLLLTMFLTLFLDGPKDMAKFMGAPSRRQNRVALREGGPEPEAAAGAWRRRPCPEGPATAADGIVKSNKDLPNLDLVAEDNFVSFPFPFTLFSFPCICIFATVDFFSRLFLPSFSHSNILDARARKGREIQKRSIGSSGGRSLIAGVAESCLADISIFFSAKVASHEITVVTGR